MPGIDFSAHVTNPIAQGPAKAVQAASSAATPAAEEKDDGFGFDDLLDIVNPLQHIPVISTIYRHLTGDKIGTPEKLAGDALFGGLTGFLCSLGDTIFEELTGKNVGDTVYAMVFGDDKPATAVASAAPAASATPATSAVPTATPASVIPASASPIDALSIRLPDFSFLNELADAPAAMPSPVIARQVTTAYRSAQRTIEAY